METPLTTGLRNMLRSGNIPASLVFWFSGVFFLVLCCCFDSIDLGGTDLEARIQLHQKKNPRKPENQGEKKAKPSSTPHSNFDTRRMERSIQNSKTREEEAIDGGRWVLHSLKQSWDVSGTYEGWKHR
jgi:hypothetical protein